MNASSRRRFQRLSSATAGLAAVANAGAATAPAKWAAPPAPPALRQQLAAGVFRFAREGVLGTSMDLLLRAARPAEAQAWEQGMVAALAQWARPLNQRDPDSEVRRVAAGAPVVSRELAAVLAAYERWEARTGGALSARLGAAVELWQTATLRPPDRDRLAAAVGSHTGLNVDALGKAYLVEQAAILGRDQAVAGLVNLGGDLRAWGDETWRVGVADPREPAENAPLLAEFALRDAAVATSGGYARYRELGGRRYSHLLDGRTGWVAEGALSATVVAPDCLTANALATAACVLGPAAGRELAEAHGAMGYLLVERDGTLTRGGCLDLTGATDQPGTSAEPPPAGAAVANGWPTGFRVAVKVVLKSPPGGRFKRPYVALWVEDGAGKVIRTVAFWGTKDKYFPEMTHWWDATKGDERTLHSVSRATRSPGEYTLLWDGKDDAGRPVEQGRYRLCLEVNREHGRHVFEDTEVYCGAAPKTAAFKATAESEPGTVDYGPKIDPP